MDIKKAIYTLLNRFTNLVQVKDLTKSYTVAANNIVAVDFTQSIDGYKMVGVVGFSSNHGSVLIQQAKILPDSNTVRFTVRNISNASITANAQLQLLYIKTPTFGGGGYNPCNINAFSTFRKVVEA